MDLPGWTQVHAHILHLEQEGLATRTFRRLHPDRQQAILLAILDEASEKGPAAANIKQVAERAGVSVGSLYTYFANRETMLAFAVEISARFMLDSLDQYRPYLVALPLRDALEACLIGGVRWSRMYIGMVRLFARAAYHGDPELADSLVRPIATVLLGMVHDMVAAGVERGEIRDDVDLEATERVIHALTIVAGDSQFLPYLNNYFQVIDKELPSERMMAGLLDLVFTGIGARKRE